MATINEEIIKIIDKKLKFEIGVITKIDETIGLCSVSTQINNSGADSSPYQCSLIFPCANIDMTTNMVWGDFQLPSIGDLVFLSLRTERPLIVAILTGYNNWDAVYDSKDPTKKLNLNRIEDADSASILEWSTIKSKILVGEKFIRSKGFADLFFDLFGNVLFDTSKEIIWRVGTRDSSNKITTPTQTFRFGTVKDNTTGLPKVDSGGKKIKVELISNTDNKMTLNESGEWVIENANGTITMKSTGEINLDSSGSTIDIKTDGTMVVNGGSIEVARNGDDVAIDSNFSQWLNTHTHPSPAGPTSAPTVPYSGALSGQISEGNPNLLCD